MDDSISRQAAIDAFSTDLNKLAIGGAENAKAVEVYLNTVIGRIKSLPSAQPKRGRWATTNLGVLGAFDCCSECKRVVSHKEPLYNFCPNCGADMRGEQNE